MKFLYATDIHFDITPEKPHYVHAVKYQEIFWDYLKNNMQDYDLFVAGGDLTVKGPACIEEIIAFKEKLDYITQKYIAIPGNHDICPIKGMEKNYPGVEEYEYTDLLNTNFAKVFGKEGIRYSKKYGAFRFIAFAIRDEDPDNQLEWLEEELRKPGKKIVFSHYPIFQTRTGGFCADWDYKRIGKVREQIAKLLVTDEYNVLLYLCGHQHINAKVPMVLGKGESGDLKLKNENFKDAKRWQIETGSLTQAVACFREFEILPDKIIVTTKQLPGIKGLLGGVMNEAKSYDNEHPDIYSYHMGNSDEQDFCINIDQ